MKYLKRYNENINPSYTKRQVDIYELVKDALSFSMDNYNINIDVRSNNFVVLDLTNNSSCILKNIKDDLLFLYSLLLNKYNNETYKKVTLQLHITNNSTPLLYTYEYKDFLTKNLNKLDNHIVKYVSILF